MSLAVDSLTREEAERLSTRIDLRLDTIADNYVAVMPLIREAIDRGAHAALGYSSPGAYVSDRFGRALSKLDGELRRSVVRELSDAGLSTRAIAPVVGVSQQAVSKSLNKVTTGLSPTEPQSPDEVSDTHHQFPTASAWSPETGFVNTATGEVVDAPTVTEHTETVKTKVTVGLDGKEYRRPVLPPVPRPVKSPEQLNAEQSSKSFGASVLTLVSLTTPEGRAWLTKAWQAGSDECTPTARDHVTPTWFREIAAGLNRLANEWEQE